MRMQLALNVVSSKEEVFVALLTGLLQVAWILSVSRRDQAKGEIYSGEETMKLDM